MSKPYNDICHEDLSAYLEHRHLVGPVGDEQALFVSRRGTRMSVRNVQDLVPRYARKAGITRRVTPHDLRRSFGSGLADAGVDVYDIRDALSHESIQTTQLYVQMASSRRRVPTEAFGRRWQREQRSRRRSSARSTQ